MSLPPEDSTEAGAEFDAVRRREYRILLLGVASAVLFALGLLLSESVGEFAVDVDFKPFFVPYLLLAVVRFGLPTMSVGLGAALGEGVLDVFEGYELDDPIGFIGYVIGFVAFGWYLHEVAEDPESTRALGVAAVLGALVQASFEAVAILIFNPGADAGAALLSALGNTATHGIVLGAVPLVALLPRLLERLDPPLA